jgi:Flp pilus assembly protein TadG
MLRPLIQRPRRDARYRANERGITLVLIALAIVGIIAMAGLSIDIGTLYQAGAEAQRAADAGALAAARFISMSGVTGNTTTKAYWVDVCGGTSSPASTVATAVAQQNTIGGASNSTVTVTYSTQGISPGFSDCSQNSSAFEVNPLVTVQVTQAGLPTYFSRIWGRTGNSVSATATAEVFNPSKSGSSTSSGNLVPVRPRCVKPWIVPNLDPGNPSGCSTSGCQPFVNNLDGSIQNPGIINSGTGVIGETFNLVPDCSSSPGNCKSGAGPPFFANPPEANITTATQPNLQYLPGQVLGTPVAVPSCGNTGAYQQAVAGCDQSTPYQCGVSGAPTPNQIDFTENPGIPSGSGDTYVATQCLIHQSGGVGQDTLLTAAYPYQIQAGAGNPLKVTGSVITSSNSIVSLPIYDGNGTTALTITGNDANVNIVGFLQVFINQANADGSLNVTVLNVAGCSNGVSSTTPYLTGTSPVPIRLITPP